MLLLHFLRKGELYDMPKSFEKISRYLKSATGKPDSNLANDSNHLGGIPAEDWATKEWVRKYHDGKENVLKKYIDRQDELNLEKAKEYANSLVRNQDFSGFAGKNDLNALDEKLLDNLNNGLNNQKNYTDNKIKDVVNDTNANFEDVNTAIRNLNNNQNDLFQSVSDGKSKIAGAITDKGVNTSATDSFDTMAGNIRKISSSVNIIDKPEGGSNLVVIPDGYINTTDATATEDKILQGYTAYANGKKLHGTLVPQGGSSVGGIVLGEDEVVATKIYGEAGVLTGGKLLPRGIDVSYGHTYAGRSNIALITTKYNGDFIITKRKDFENVDNEIVIYNVSSTNILYHKSENSKFSYTYEELGIEGTIKCISASPIEKYTDIVQVSIGTTAGIYNYLFNAGDNSGNGSIGSKLYNGIEVFAEKIVLSDTLGDVSSIAYANKDANVMAISTAEGKIKIYSLHWVINSKVPVIEYVNENRKINTGGCFRFNGSDTFLVYAPWGQTKLFGDKMIPSVGLMLLEDYRCIVHQAVPGTEEGEFYANCQLLINSANNFAILCGKPYKLDYSIIQKNIEFTKLSDTKIIPYEVSNQTENQYSTFSQDDKMVYGFTGYRRWYDINELL